MAIQVSYPGVYIDEFEPAAPIQGVSTSVAAFLGANAIGPTDPTLVTSWDEYRRLFALPAPTPPEDDDYLWYAVRGFFENGGQTCFVTAISNAKPDSIQLPDETGGTNYTITVSARRKGVLNPPLQVMSVKKNVVTTANVYVIEPALTNDAAAGDTVVKIANQERFLAGDKLEIFTTGGNAKKEPVTVAYTDAVGVHLRSQLQNAYPTADNAALRFAPFAVGQKAFRVSGPTTAAGPRSLVVGSIITLTQQGGVPQSTIITGVRAERISNTLTTYHVEVRDAVAGFTFDTTKPIAIVSEEFTLTVQEVGSNPVVYADLSMSAMHPNYYEKVINGDQNGLIRVEPVASNTTALPQNRPIQNAFAPLTGGVAHSATALAGGNEYVTALAALAPIKDVSIVAIPDRTDAVVQQALLAHCFNLWDRVAIFDPQAGADFNTIQTQQSSLQDAKGFGALYYPRIEVASVKTGQRLLVPPSGHVAGIYARTDIRRGVFKAPAGNEATINGAQGVETPLTDSQQGIINLKGVNVIRVFSRGGRPIVWGARTTSTDTNWQYVNIRRLFLYLEESIQVGIRGSVFEPNNQTLWQRLKRTITAFLTQQWRDGALFGRKPEEAFYVRIDDALNPDNERALGRLYIEIGVRPSYPAEFIIVRIGIWQGGSDVSES
jgi:phage tail sheath protein FI